MFCQEGDFFGELAEAGDTTTEVCRCRVPLISFDYVVVDIKLF